MLGSLQKDKRCKQVLSHFKVKQLFKTCSMSFELHESLLTFGMTGLCFNFNVYSGPIHESFDSVRSGLGQDWIFHQSMFLHEVFIRNPCLVHVHKN